MLVRTGPEPEPAPRPADHGRTAAGFGANRVAIVVDVRSREQFDQLPQALRELKDMGCSITSVFLEADDDVIVQRQESNRRPLPLQFGGRLIEGIDRERRLLADQRAQADIVVDTTRLSARQLVQRIVNHFGDEATDRLKIALISFGFKNGVPIDAAMQVVNQVRAGDESGSVVIGPKAYLGITVADTSSLVVASVVSGGPAATAGLSVGATITASMAG